MSFAKISTNLPAEGSANNVTIVDIMHISLPQLN
jgi:hypothetical protein